MENTEIKLGFIPNPDFANLLEKIMALEISNPEKGELVKLIMIYGDSKWTLGKNSVK